MSIAKISVVYLEISAKKSKFHVHRWHDYLNLQQMYLQACGLYALKVAMNFC